MNEEVSLSRLEGFFKGLKLYLHFKGKLVVKVGESIHTETGETLYQYREFNLDIENWDKRIWSRPMGMFLENVPFKNEPRFKPITPAEAAKLLYPVINSKPKQQ